MNLSLQNVEKSAIFWWTNWGFRAFVLPKAALGGAATLCRLVLWFWSCRAQWGRDLWFGSGIFGVKLDKFCRQNCNPWWQIRSCFQVLKRIWLRHKNLLSWKFFRSKSSAREKANRRRKPWNWVLRLLECLKKEPPYLRSRGSTSVIFRPSRSINSLLSTFYELKNHFSNPILKFEFSTPSIILL